MRKWIGIIAVSIGVYIVIFGGAMAALNLFEKAYKNLEGNGYSNYVSATMYKEKLLGMELQDAALERGDNYFILGSSELGGASRDPFHPVNVFKGKKAGFQVNIVGRGNMQSLIHSINLLARKDGFVNDKITFIVSPQWFTQGGLKKDKFLMNFSKIQLYSLLKDETTDYELKEKVLNRILYMIKDESNYQSEKRLINRYLRGGRMSLFLLPLMEFDYKYLQLKDIKGAADILLKYNKLPEKTSKEEIDWKILFDEAERTGEENTSNDFFVDDGYYQKHLESKLGKFKNSQKTLKLTQSPEYEDFETLLKIFKSYNMDVLIVNTPVNGRWYDYTGLSREEREGCYNKVSELVEKYDFKELDLSKKEYDKYTLKDIMHLGWKGWVFIDEAIYKHYKENI